MPAYHIVLHSHGSWLPDRPEGYYDRKIEGRLPTDEKTANIYRSLMARNPVQFSESEQAIILQESEKIAIDAGWKCHAVAVTETHVHVVVSWRWEQRVEIVIGRLKQILTRRLKEYQDHPQARLFSRGAGTTRLRDWDHLVELMKYYFPRHGRYVKIVGRLGLWFGGSA